MEEIKKLNGLEKLDELDQIVKEIKNITLSERIYKLINKPIIWMSPVALASLVYLGVEFYKKGQLVFTTKNQFNFYIVFSLIIFGMYFCLQRKTSEVIVQNKEIASQNVIIMSQNEEIKESNVVIKDLLGLVVENLVENEEKMAQFQEEAIDLHRSTRKIIVKAIDNKDSKE